MGSTYALGYEGVELGTTNTQWQSTLITISFGYFVYDMVFMAVLGLLDRAMIIHHGLVIFGFYVVLTTGLAGGEIMSCMFSTEISNPFMHGRIILKSNGLRHTKIYERMEYTYMALYTYGRLFFGSRVVFDTWLSPCNVFVKICGTGLLVQSYYYIFYMAALLRTRYNERSERKKKGVKLQWFSVTKDLDKLDYTKRNTKMKIL